ncbi:MAG: winged helix-turn-helix transcriptional regulator [Ruegeria sp.]
MTRYGQFCPVAKSAEILGYPWALLIVRELLLGSTRFSTLQRGMPRISPTVLTARLKELETEGIIIKRPLQGRRGHAYQLTEAGRELAPVIEALVVWGMRWARDALGDEDIDVSFLMFDIERNLVADALPGGETVICFRFPDLDSFGTWWVVAGPGGTDLCYRDPGKDVSVYVTARSRDLMGIWMGDIGLRAALDDGRLTVIGDAPLCRGFSRWFPLSTAAPIKRPSTSRGLRPAWSPG